MVQSEASVRSVSAQGEARHILTHHRPVLVEICPDPPVTSTMFSWSGPTRSAWYGWQPGDHARFIRTMPDYLPHEPEAGFGHYLATVASVGGDRCRAPGSQFSDYENATGTSQVHVWFDRPSGGWTG